MRLSSHERQMRVAVGLVAIMNYVTLFLVWLIDWLSRVIPVMIAEITYGLNSVVLALNNIGCCDIMQLRILISILIIWNSVMGSILLFVSLRRALRRKEPIIDVEKGQVGQPRHLKVKVD